MKHHVIFINGDPRSGKDTASAMLEEAFEKHGFFAGCYSSIEPVRRMLRGAGFDLDGKTEADRKLLSEVGDSVEAHSSFRSKACIEYFEAGLRIAQRSDKPVALILHTREPHTIYKIAFGLRHHDVRFITLFLEGRGEKVSSNASDAGVRDMKYDVTLYNTGTLDALRESCEATVRNLVETPEA